MNRVAVTGMGVISPVGNTVDSFKNSIMSGISGIGPITHFDTTDYKVTIAAEVKDFDPLDWMDKSDARRADLYTQFAVAAAAQAMDDAALAGHIAPERLGVYIGSGVGGMNTFESNMTTLLERGPRRVSPFFIPMMIGNMAAGTVAMKHSAMGPCLPIVTACATSTNTIGEAYRAIKHGYADAIIAGGAEATITPLSIAGFINCMALTSRNDPATASIPFDKRRDGFVMGEGAAVLVLENYEHAVARGATIYAEVIGYGNSCDAHHMTAPHPEALGAALAIEQALREAQVSDSATIYFNAHGTSTELNDKCETLALKKVFGDRAYDLLVSSTKSMTGHMLGAAGATEAIASICALRERLAPPTIGYEEPDPDCDLDYVPNKARPANIDVAFSTSLGFGGHNGCLVFKKAQ